jgi:hypothetical protein
VNQPYKACPRCNTPTPLEVGVCSSCGHQYRTKFATPSSNQTQAFNMHPQPQGPVYQQPNTWQCPRCMVLVSSMVSYCQHCGFNPWAAAQPRVNTSVTGYVVGSVILAFLSLLMCPPVFGGGAIACGYKVKTSGKEGLGIGLMVMSGACMAVGIFVGMILAARTLR